MPRDFNWNDDLSLTRKGMGPLPEGALATPGETPPPAVGAAKGDPARYRLGSRLGRSGQVYEAQSDRFPGRVAVKLLPFAAGLPPAAVRSFTQEATRVAELRHPHVVAVLTASVFADGTPFMAMERLAGETLEDRVARLRVFTLVEVLPVVRGLASALSAAHAIGVVHREIRTDNVFISDLPGYGIGFARLLDFGVSRLTAAARDAGRIVAPAAWRVLAPELQQGQLAAMGDRGWQALMDQADERTDQFALAALTYRLLAGTEPIAGQEVGTAFERVNDERSERCPTAVDVVLCKALSRRPEQRYDSMALFFRAFEEACADALASERGGNPAPRRVAERSPIPAIIRNADQEETRPAITGIEPATRPSAPASADAPTVVSWPGDGAPRPSAMPERSGGTEGGAAFRSASMAASPGSLTQQFFADGDRQEADWLKGLARRQRTGADHGVGETTDTTNTPAATSAAGTTGRASTTRSGTEDFLDLSASFDRPDQVPRRRAPLIAGAVAATLLGFGAVGWAVGLWSPGAWLADHTAPSFQHAADHAAPSGPPLIAPPTPTIAPAPPPTKPAATTTTTTATATAGTPPRPLTVRPPAPGPAAPARTAAPRAPAATRPHPEPTMPPTAPPTAPAPERAAAPEEVPGVAAPSPKKDPLRGMAWSANRRRMIRSRPAPIPSESSPPPGVPAPAVQGGGEQAVPGWPPPAATSGWPQPGGVPAADNPPPPPPPPAPQQ